MKLFEPMKDFMWVRGVPSRESLVCKTFHYTDIPKIAFSW